MPELFSIFFLEWKVRVRFLATIATGVLLTAKVSEKYLTLPKLLLVRLFVPQQSDGSLGLLSVVLLEAWSLLSLILPVIPTGELLIPRLKRDCCCRKVGETRISVDETRISVESCREVSERWTFQQTYKFGFKKPITPCGSHFIRNWIHWFEEDI